MATSEAQRRLRTSPVGASRTSSTELKVSDETALVLHTYPYRETSLIVDALSRNHGRVALVARGAKRPRSALRGLLLGFQPISVSWSGSRNSELRTLTKAEWIGGLPAMRGDALLCGFYLNELLIKLLARDDAHENLFDAYLIAIGSLANGAAFAPVLRAFEYALLREAGYAVQLNHCASTEALVVSDRSYRYVPEHGPVETERQSARGEFAIVLGKTLQDIEAGDYTDPVTLQQSKHLMRQLLTHHLGGQILNTRQMMADLNNL